MKLIFDDFLFDQVVNDKKRRYGYIFRLEIDSIILLYII